MIDTQSILAVTAAGFVLSCSPGPSMFYIMSITASMGNKAGFISAMGLASGGVFHVVLAAAGISAIIASNEILFGTVKIAGAIYLFYLGGSAAISLFVKRENPDTIEVASTLKSKSYLELYLQSAFVEISNPKTIIFFLSFIPQFIKVENGSIVVQSIVLGLMVPLTAIPSDLIIAFGGGVIIKKLLNEPRSGKILNAASAFVLIALGLRVLIN